MRQALLLVLLFAVHTSVVHADTGPTLDPAEWTGAWDVTMTASYSTCPKQMPEGDTRRSTLNIVLDRDGLRAKEIPVGKGLPSLSYDYVGLKPSVPPVLRFRWRERSSEAGLRVFMSDTNELAGLRVVVNTQGIGAPCAIVYDVRGVRLTDASGNRVGAARPARPGPVAAPGPDVAVGDVDDFDSTSLDANDVKKVIEERYLRGVRHCYESLLKLDPRAGGRIEIEFTVGSSGRVTKSKVTGDVSVGGCIKEQVDSWQFSAPKDKRGRATQATFAVPMVLRPR